MSPVIAGRKSARWKNSARRCWWKKESWKRIRGELLTQSTIHADETVMQMHKEKDRPDTLGLRMGVYSSAKRADIQLRCFEYRESRSGKWARNFLEGFSGVLITDGYSGYNKVQDAEYAGCRAHLYAFLEHGEIEISDNQVENVIRPFVVGRKEWLFADTPQGAETSTIIYSLMETAKANSLRLDDYMLHLLSILPERSERNKDFEIDDLLPLVRRNDVVVPGSVSAGNHGFSVSLSGYVATLICLQPRRLISIKL